MIVQLRNCMTDADSLNPSIYGTILASFPGHSRLQFSIAYSMQKWMGRPGRKSHMIDGR